MRRILSILMVTLMMITIISPMTFAKSKDKNKDKNPTPVVTDAPKVKVKVEKPKSWQPELKVGILSSSVPINVKTNLPSLILNAKDNEFNSLNNGSSFVISTAGKIIYVNEKSTGSSEIEIRPKDQTKLKEMQTTIDGQTYFGGLKIISTGNRMTIISIVAIEEYLRAVVPNEMESTWNEEALKAQAIAARTFALENRGRHKDDGYDLCSTGHCQQYTTVNVVTEATDNAIYSTFGEVLFYKGKTISSTFHADSGGMTENALDVWGNNYPYLRASTELETRTQPWERKFTLEECTKKLVDSKHNVGNFQFIKLTNLELGKLTSDRSTSGRVKELTVIGSAGEIKLSGNEIRSIFNLPSTLFDVSVSGDVITFSGFGRGHGVGMSQYGAKNFAEHGYTYDKILYHYYKGTTLKRLY